MLSIRRIACALAAPMFVSAAIAQNDSIPKDLSGRWTFASASRSNIFSLDEISPTPNGEFTAKLTWWTTDPKCTIRKEPITGKVTPTGIAFDAKTKCDVEFTAVLDRKEGEWSGQATTRDSNRVVIDMKAK